LSDLVAPAAAETPEQRVLLLQEITQAADEAPTVQDALRAVLSRVCERMAWQAGRLQFTSEAGDLAQRTFWHLADPEKLVSFRSLAEERRQPNQTGLLARVVREGKPTWAMLPEGPDAHATGTRVAFAFPILVGKRVFAVLEFFSEHPHEPQEALLDTLGIVCAGLGSILQRKPAEEELRRSERDYRALFESAHDAILIVDPVEATVLDANQRCSEIYGYSRAELIGLPLDRVWRNPDRDRLARSARGEGGDFEAQHLRKDGREIAVDVAAGPIEFRGRRAVWMSNRDVTDRARTLLALRTSEERYRLLFDASPLPMWVFDQQTLGFLAVNEAAVARYGYSREQFSQMTLADIGPTEGFDGSADDHAARVVTGAATIWRHKRRTGELIDVEITSHELEWGGKPARLVVANDVTERLRAEQKLWHAAFYDGLTGLPNRQLFMERLGQTLERARGRDASNFAVLFLDLDRFKVVNDSMGHRAGDQLLVSRAGWSASGARATRWRASAATSSRCWSRGSTIPPRRGWWRSACSASCRRPLKSTARRSSPAPRSASRWGARRRCARKICCATPTPRCTAPRRWASRGTRSSTSPCTTTRWPRCSSRTTCAARSIATSCG
jgi:PAS domain S-box-containing protein